MKCSPVPRHYFDRFPAPFFGGPFPAARKTFSFFCHRSCFSVSRIGLPSYDESGGGYQLAYRAPFKGLRKIFWPERCPGPAGFLVCPHISAAISFRGRPVAGAMPLRISTSISSSDMFVESARPRFGALNLLIELNVPLAAPKRWAARNRLPRNILKTFGNIPCNGPADQALLSRLKAADHCQRANPGRVRAKRIVKAVIPRRSPKEGECRPCPTQFVHCPVSSLASNRGR